MANPLAPTDLPWSAFGRRVKPLAFAASLANASIALGLINPGNYFVQIPHTLVMIAALAAVLAFWFGWWFNTVRLVQSGLILTVGVFAARAALSALSVGFFDPITWLSLSWVVAAGGAFLLEKRAPASWTPEAYGGRK